MDRLKYWIPAFAGMTFLVAASANAATKKKDEPAAGAVVQSQEWEVRRAKDGKVEEFKGDVRYNAGPNSFNSDWAEFEHAINRWHARGRVKAVHRTDKGETFEAQGDEAVYNEKSKKGSLWATGPVRLKRTLPPPSLGPDLGTTGFMEWAGEEDVRLSKGVHIWGPRIETWADDADYLKKTGTLTLNGGRPVLVKFKDPKQEKDWTGAVKADQITILEKTKVLKADGKAVGWIVFKKADSKSKKGAGAQKQ